MSTADLKVRRHARLLDRIGTSTATSRGIARTPLLQVVEADLQVRLLARQAICIFTCVPFKLSTRLPSFDYLGLHRYSVTICVEGRRRAFATDRAVDLVRTQLEITADEECFEIIAYCFMPDHLHVLAQGSEDHARFLRFMKTFKQRSAFHWKRRYGDRLWQRSYIERVLRDHREEEDTFRVARYILENPIRAGLVKSPEDYPYSGSFVMDLADLLDSLRRT